MKTVNVHAAKTNLSELLKRAHAGEEIVIARDGVPVARLVPILDETHGRKFGVLEGRLKVNASFFEPLPLDELSAWTE